MPLLYIFVVNGMSTIFWCMLIISLNAKLQSYETHAIYVRSRLWNENTRKKWNAFPKLPASEVLRKYDMETTNCNSDHMVPWSKIKEWNWNTLSQTITIWLYIYALILCFSAKLPNPIANTLVIPQSSINYSNSELMICYKFNHKFDSVWVTYPSVVLRVSPLEVYHPVPQGLESGRSQPAPNLRDLTIEQGTRHIVQFVTHAHLTSQGLGNEKKTGKSHRSLRWLKAQET